MEEHNPLLIPILMGAGITSFRLLVGFMLYFFPSISALVIIVIASFVSGLLFCSVIISYASSYLIGLAFFGGAFPCNINIMQSKKIKLILSTVNIFWFFKTYYFSHNKSIKKCCNHWKIRSWQTYQLHGNAFLCPRNCMFHWTTYCR